MSNPRYPTPPATAMPPRAGASPAVARAGFTRRRFLRHAVISAGMLTLAACDQGGGSATSPTASPTAGGGSAGATPTPGGTLVMGLNLEPEVIDPHVSTYPQVETTVNLVAETLLNIDQDYNLYPGLAEDWKIADDGTVELTLRSGVMFSDGEAFDAEAVKANLDRIVDPDTGSAVARDYLSYSTYDGTEVVDERTVRIHFTEPFAPILIGLAQGRVAMLSPKTLREYGSDAVEHPVGTGPFEFVEWVGQSHLLFRKRPDYDGGGAPYAHEGAAYLDEVKFLVAEDAATRVGLLESGEAQLIQAVPAQDAQRLEDAGFDVVQGPKPGAPKAIYLVTGAEPTNDIAVRKAMLHATDRQAIIDTAYFGFDHPEHGPLNHRAFGYNPAVESMYPFDLDKARRLLDDAGWVEGDDGVRVRDGVRASVLHYVTVLDEQLAPLYQAQMREIGIEVTLENREYPVAFEAALKGETQSQVDQYGAADPAFALNCYFHSDNLGACTLSGFTTDELDQLLSSAAQETDADKRAELYHQVQEIIMDNALMIPISNAAELYASNGVEGWKPFPVQPSRALLYDAQLTT